VKNEDEIDDSHKSQLKYKYEVSLLNYKIKIENLKTVNWAFEVLKFFLKTLIKT